MVTYIAFPAILSMDFTSSPAHQWRATASSPLKWTVLLQVLMELDLNPFQWVLCNSPRLSCGWGDIQNRGSHQSNLTQVFTK
jgi:hypothetical protein